MRTAFEVLLALHGARVLTACAPADGLALLEQHSVDLVIQDMNFHREATSGEEGITLFRTIRARFPQLPIILLTAWTHLETAVELVRAGASDYVAKPGTMHACSPAQATCSTCAARARKLRRCAVSAARRAQRSPRASICAASSTKAS